MHIGKASVLQTIVHDSARCVDFWVCVCAEKNYLQFFVKMMHVTCDNPLSYTGKLATTRKVNSFRKRKPIEMLHIVLWSWESCNVLLSF